MAKREWYKRLPWIRLTFTFIALLVIVFCVGLIAYGSTSTSNDIALGILAGITALFALGQWFFPFSPKQPEEPHLPLVRELVRSSFKMGDESAANFPYITTPIQTVYTLAKQSLLESSTGASYKRGILIVGEANAGKTRLALETLIKTLPDWPVLRWWPDSTIDKVSLHEKHLVVFIDDLQDYVSPGRKEVDVDFFIADPRTTTLRTILERLRQEIPRVVVVATCRLEDKERVQAELGQLFNELEVLQLPTFTVDVHNPETTTIITEFQRHGSPHTQDWDGTLGSLVLGLSTKNHEYLKIRNEPAGVVLRAMKLLTTANIWSHTKRLLLAVCTQIFGEKRLLDEHKWQEAVNRLVQEQFVTEEEEQNSPELILVIRKDTYFEKVITDYPASNRPYLLKQDLIRLQSLLVTLKDANGLVNLGVALGHLERNEEALQAFEQAIELKLNDARVYYNKGVALADMKRYEEALQAFEQAIELKLNDARVYYNKGLTLSYFERNEEALQAYNRAIDLDPKFADAHYNKGAVFGHLGKYEEALQAFEKAIELKLNDARVYYNKGIVLAYFERNEEALQAFDRAIELNLNDARAYFHKGVALVNLGKYEEALQAFEQAIELDPNDALVYVYKGTAFDCLGKYEEALQAFEQAIELDPKDERIQIEKMKLLREIGYKEDA